MAKEKFDLTKMLGNRKVLEVMAPTKSKTAAMTMINICNLVPSPENFYSIEDVTDLKDSIEMFGVKQPLLIEPIPGTTNYKIIAGHRRREASRLLVEEGKKDYEDIPCIIETDITPTEREILLIITNFTTREISPYEKTKQVTRLKELFREYKKNHKLPGRIQEMIADVMKISKTQVGRMEKIEKNLSDDLKEEFKHNRITFSAASELARLSPTEQHVAYEAHKETGKTSLKQVQEQKEKPEQSEEETGGNFLTVRALSRVKDLLEGEAAKIKTDDDEGKTVEGEYRIILLLKAEEVQREIASLLNGPATHRQEAAVEWAKKNLL